METGERKSKSRLEASHGIQARLERIGVVYAFTILRPGPLDWPSLVTPEIA